MDENKELMLDGMVLHGPGECPECHMPIIVADVETTVMDLNSDGIPINEETSYRCSGICSRCGKRINVMRWKGGYVPYSKASRLFKIYQLQEEKNKRLAALENNRYILGNPLVQEKKE
jgi:hypothetical protein